MKTPEMISKEKEALERLHAKMRRRAEEHLEREAVDFIGRLGEAFARIEEYNVGGALSTTAIDALLEIASMTLALGVSLSVGD